MGSIAIIGAGLGGLSAAAELISNGHDVTIFERQSEPGGRAAKITRSTPSGEYLMECGPTVFTMLDVARKPFDSLDLEMDSLVEMIKVDPAYQGRFSDGAILNWPSSRDNIHQTLSEFAGEDQAKGFDKYTKWLEKLVDVEYDPFIVNNFSSPLSLIKSPGALMKLLSMGAFRKMDKKVRKFIDDERIVNMSTFQALYAGVTPSQALAVYCIISYMDLVEGVYYPKGGMYKYAQTLCDSLTNAGAKTHFDVNVTGVAKNSVGLEVVTENGKELFDAVICNADLPMSYPEIFNQEIPKKIQDARYSPSCLLYVVGGKATKKDTQAHHTIYFSDDAKGSFDDLVNKRQMMKDPSVLISNPTLTDDSIAPNGSDVFYVLEPSPHLDSNVDFEANKDEHLQRMRGHLTKAGITMETTDAEIFIDPSGWEKQGMYRGTPFSLAHTFFQSGPFRPKNIVKSLPGVFLCGTGTTPGVGIPMVIESGRLAAQRVDDFFSKIKER